MANTAGKVGSPNEGSTTDMERGSSLVFPYTKGNRKTGKVGSGMPTANSVEVDANKRTISDQRVVKG